MIWKNDEITTCLCAISVSCFELWERQNMWVSTCYRESLCEWEMCAIDGGGSICFRCDKQTEDKEIIGGRQERGTVPYRTGTGTLAKNSVASYHQRKKWNRPLITFKHWLTWISMHFDATPHRSFSRLPFLPLSLHPPPDLPNWPFYLINSAMFIFLLIQYCAWSSPYIHKNQFCIRWLIYNCLVLCVMIFVYECSNSMY